MLNPWPSFETTQQGVRKKTARLIGKEPGKVFVLATLSDFRGRALRLYHVPSRQMRHFSRPNQKLWDQYASAGVEIPFARGVDRKSVV